MHTTLLISHIVVAIAVLALFAFALWRSFSGIVAKGGWLPADEKARRFLPIALDIALVLGIALWATLSPSPRGAFLPGAPADLFFKAAVHPIASLLAITIVHVGSVKTREQKTPRDKFRTMGLFYAIALLCLAAQMGFQG